MLTPLPAKSKLVPEGTNLASVRGRINLGWDDARMSILQPVKRALRTTAVNAPLRWVFEAALGDRAVVFMLHRFQHPDLGVAGHDPQALRRILGELRRRGCAFVDIGELARRLRTPGATLAKTVAFTIDDGYVDQAEIGAPAFAEYDCPVTTFVTTGFLDGELWFWWDRIAYLFQRVHHGVELTLDDVRLSYSFSKPDEARRAQGQFIDWCKHVPDGTKHRAIAALARAAEVELPHQAPPEYAPMSWDQLRQCEARGMTFGPHTVTHPILSQTSDAQAREELAGSWTRLRREAKAPVPVFCYPNGQPADFGEREVRILADLQLTAAVVGTPGYLEHARVNAPERMFRLQRFSWSDVRSDVLQCTSGVEWVKVVLRGRRA